MSYEPPVENPNAEERFVERLDIAVTKHMTWEGGAEATSAPESTVLQDVVDALDGFADDMIEVVKDLIDDVDPSLADDVAMLERTKAALRDFREFVRAGAKETV